MKTITFRITMKNGSGILVLTMLGHDDLIFKTTGEKSLDLSPGEHTIMASGRPLEEGATIYLEIFDETNQTLGSALFDRERSVIFRINI